MRFYSGFLLLEDVYDNLPTSQQEINSFADSIFNPYLLVSTLDCETQLGTIKDLDYSIEGDTELATGMIINNSRINAILAMGLYKVAVRETRSCTAVGGVCQACYKATFPDMPVPDVNTRVRVESNYYIGTDIFIGNGITATFPLSLSATDYTDTLVYYMGARQSGYTITNSILTMPFIPVINAILVVHFRLKSAKPLFGYIAQAYTGGLLGIKALPTESLIVRPSLIHSVISDGQLARIKSLLSSFTTIESTYYNYIDAIPDRLEKALYMIMLYGIYGNVTI